MPKTGQAGYSENTPLKQEHFRTIMHTLCPIIRSILHRHGHYAAPRMLYVDLRAGPGIYADYTDLFHHGLLGSPLLTLKAARASSLPLQAYLLDSDPQAILSLHQSLPLYGGVRRQGEDEPARFSDAQGVYQFCVCAGDSADYTPRILSMAAHQAQKFYGVVYADVNGGTIPVAELAAYSQLLSLTDIVFHYSGTYRKRVHGRFDNRPPLVEVLPQIKKDYWIVRKPYHQEQWTFLIGTNWDSFPKFERQGFVRTDSPLGRDIMHRLSYRTGEQG